MPAKAIHINTVLQNMHFTFLADLKKNDIHFSHICKQEAQLSPSDSAMRLVCSNLANCHATVQKLLIRQVLTKLMVRMKLEV